MGPASSTASVQHQLEEQAKVATEIIETKDAEIALAQDHILYLEERLAGLKEKVQSAAREGKITPDVSEDEWDSAVKMDAEGAQPGHV